MLRNRKAIFRFFVIPVLIVCSFGNAQSITLLQSITSLRAQANAETILTPRFPLKQSGLELQRGTQVGSFFDVVGRRSAVFGYENRAFEAWVYPMKILDDFRLAFRLQGYPLDIYGPDVMTGITARPEATIFTYAHAAFTVRQIIYAPVDEPGVIMLLDVQSVLPMTITGFFRPRLSLMWPAGLMTGYLGWDEAAHMYFIGEETNRFVGLVGSPLARDVSVQPYQEEPRDVPAQFIIEASPDRFKSSYIPIIIAGSVEGRAKAKETYDRLLASAQSLYEKNAEYYELLLKETASISTPDERLNQAFAWAKVGVDKGMATNPFLGTGLIAGFRTSGESERPGFAWYFGRDALWTTFAINSYGDFASTRTALDFLKKAQRADGKIPHEISQSATLIPWFTDYPYPWASADATPLYIIGHADYWRMSGDLDFIRQNWESVVKAYRFTAATDTDNNGLIENTKFGHGWVEGGALYPPHEEIYMQGIWMEALTGLAEMAEAMGDARLAADARAEASRTRKATEATYWLPSQGYYAFATNLPPATPRVAEPGPNREVRQQRMAELDKARLIDEDTVLPAVPLWWRTLEDERAQAAIDHIGGGAMATDWGARIISNRSRLYDPLSYHYGSVWPLFTGWASMGAYRYGRAHVGHQALWANALLTYQGALGYVTELLSGDFNTAFGRSSHHQVWSEAMVITPAMRGLLGIEASGAGRVLTFAPQLPANWERVAARNVAAGKARYDLTLERAAGRMTVKVTRSGQEAGPGVQRIVIAPALPLDAQVRSATVNGRAAKFQAARMGDGQRVEVVVENPAPSVEVGYTLDEGTDVYLEPVTPLPGATNEGLRVLRSRAEANALRLTLEGLGGRAYSLWVRSPRRVGGVEGVRVGETRGRDTQLTVNFDGPGDSYTRRELTIPLTAGR
ncbi:MAG TPA: GH116 family glycosyl hydrolase [Blastocatellia bacterium]|nr:GH116 family glycosyl hydrolase [Blastocatellia bacterium]